MPTVQIEADNVGDRIVALVDRKCRRSPCRLAGAIAVAAVEDLVLVDYDWLAQPVGGDIGD
jgi:hypothetical protein